MSRWPRRSYECGGCGRRSTQGSTVLRRVINCPFCGERCEARLVVPGTSTSPFASKQPRRMAS